MGTQTPPWATYSNVSPLSKEIFPNIQSKLSLMQLEAIDSHPIADCFGGETNTCLTTTSFQVAAKSKKVPPQSPLL